MGQPLSMDLRSRVLAAIDEGTSCRAAAVRFGVAPSTAIRWFAQRRKTGGFAPKPQGGDMRSRRVEERRADIVAAWEARKDISLEELRAGLVEVGLHVSVAGLHRFFVRHGITRKKRLAMPSSRTGPTSSSSARSGSKGKHATADSIADGVTSAAGAPS